MTRKGVVVRKIVVGCNGMEIRALVNVLRANPTNDPEKLRALARELEFGCDACLVVQVTPTSFVLPDGFEFEQGSKDFERWRDKFPDPKFNPRWDNGTAPYAEIIELPDA